MQAALPPPRFYHLRELLRKLLKYMCHKDEHVSLANSIIIRPTMEPFMTSLDSGLQFNRHARKTYTSLFLVTPSPAAYKFSAICDLTQLRHRSYVVVFYVFKEVIFNIHAQSELPLVVILYALLAVQQMRKRIGL